MGHAPSEVLEITVAVRARSGSCALQNETPASEPTRNTTSFDWWSQKPRPYRLCSPGTSLRGRTISSTQSGDDPAVEERAPER